MDATNHEQDTSMMYEEDVVSPEAAAALDRLAEEEAEDEAEGLSVGHAPEESPWMGKRQLVAPNYSPVEILLAKLERWLIQQPEWAVILAAPRATRRAAVSLLAKRLLTIPNRYSNFGQ